MGASCGCPGAHSNNEPEDFIFKNEYKSTNNIDEEKIRTILVNIATGQSQLEYRKYAAYISQQPRQQFSDNNFKQFDTNFKTQSCVLQRLYNFSRLGLQKVYLNRSSPLNMINQQEVELSYLASVFYLICQKTELKQKIFITKLINPHSAYILRLFCNGIPNNVIVDTRLPVSHSNIKYLSIRHPQEIWPFLLQKAWCKQIGGYDKARGLSPQDCFQQITGVPAFSYPLTKYPPKTNLQKILEAIRLRFWIVLIASELVNTVLPRQVFYVEKYNEKEEKFIIRSPYNNYCHPKKNSTQSIEINFSQILSLFEFITIGAYIQNYSPISYRFTSLRNEQKIFQLNVMITCKLNIRLVQFYQEYLSKSQQDHYQYSPVLMELYNQNYSIVPNFYGRRQNLQGLRSSNLCENIFEPLKPGIYYLRIQIKWETQQNQASVVIYCPKNSITLTQYKSNVMGLSGKLLGYTLQSPSNQILDSKSQQIRVRHTIKTYGHILGIQNLSKIKASLKVIFRDSYNIRVNHHQIQGNTLLLELQGFQERVIQILPSDPRKQYYLAPFDIVKL